MAVSIHLDTKDLAEQYDGVSESQFADGCVLLEKLLVKPGDSVLDIGCGTGALGQKIIGVIGKSGRYIGVDPSKERINVAVARTIQSNAMFRVGVAEDLSFIPDFSIDIVFINWVFHWVPDKQIVLKNILRVLRPGGKIGFTIPSKELREIVELTKVIDEALRKPPYKAFVRSEQSTQKQYNLTATELIELLTEAGLKIHDLHLQLNTRTFSTAEDVTRFLSASYFGNYLNHVPEAMREQAKRDIEKEFETYRTAAGLQFDYYPLFAVAQKLKET